jgi:chromosome segregation ATPase
MKKIEVIEFVKKMDKGLTNLNGELSVALAERDQADEANQKLDDQKIIDQEQIKILQAEVSRLEKAPHEENKKLKEGIENIQQLITTAYGKSDEKNKEKEEILKLKEENKMLKETINQMKELLSHV